jgi:hypothetical protein
VCLCVCVCVGGRLLLFLWPLARVALWVAPRTRIPHPSHGGAMSPVPKIKINMYMHMVSYRGNVQR